MDESKARNQYNIGNSNGRAVMTDYDIAEIRAMDRRIPTLRKMMFYALVATHYEVSTRQVIRIVKGTVWKHVRDWTDGFRKFKPSRKVRRLLKAIWDRHMLLTSQGVENYLSPSRHRPKALQRALDIFFIQFWATRVGKPQRQIVLIERDEGSYLDELRELGIGWR